MENLDSRSGKEYLDSMLDTVLVHVHVHVVRLIILSKAVINESSFYGIAHLHLFWQSAGSISIGTVYPRSALLSAYTRSWRVGLL